MGLLVEGRLVSVRGGPYGNSYVQVGDVAGLTQQIVADNTPATPAAPIYDLRVLGNGEITFNSATIVRPSVDIKKYAVARPDSADEDALEAIVRSALASILPVIDSLSVTVLSDSTSTLVLSATASRSTNLPGNNKESEYEVVLTFTQR